MAWRLLVFFNLWYYTLIGVHINIIMEIVKIGPDIECHKCQPRSYVHAPPHIRDGFETLLLKYNSTKSDSRYDTRAQATTRSPKEPIPRRKKDTPRRLPSNAIDNPHPSQTAQTLQTGQTGIGRLDRNDSERGYAPKEDRNATPVVGMIMAPDTLRERHYKNKARRDVS